MGAVGSDERDCVGVVLEADAGGTDVVGHHEVETLAPKANKVTLACLIPIWRRENNPTDKTADAVARAVTEVGNPDIRVSPESVIQCGTPFLGMQSKVLQVRMGAVNCLRVYWSRLSSWWSI